MILTTFNMALAIITMIFTVLTMVAVQNSEELDPIEKKISSIYSCMVIYIAITTIVNQIQLM